MERLKSLSLYIFVGLLVYMPLHIFISTWLGTSFGFLDFAKVFKDIVLIFGFGLTLFLSLDKPWFRKILSDKLVLLMALYTLLTVLIAAFRPTDTDAEVLGVVFNLRFFIFFIYGIMLTHHFKFEQLKRSAVRSVFFISFIVLIFGALQYLVLPDNALSHVGYSRENGVLAAFFIDDKIDLERAMSTLRDPNSFGSYVLIILSLSLAYFVATKDKNLKKILSGLLLLSILCLWFSFSRSAWLGAVIIVTSFALLMINKKRVLNKRLILISLAALVTMAGAIYANRNSYLVQNIVFHADKSTKAEDPNELRLRFWHESIEDAKSSPLGHGPGTAGLASIHNEKQGTILNENYYLQLLHEVGLLGLVLFLVIILILGVRLYQQPRTNTLAVALLVSLIGLSVTNLLVHIWSNEAVAITWWGLAGVVSGMIISPPTRAIITKDKKG